MLKLKLQYFGILMQKDDSLAKFLASLVDQMVKSLTAVRETQVWSLGQEDPLEKEMATHSSILAWKSPWMEEPGRLQSMGLHRVRHSWATSLSLSDAGKDWGQKEKRALEDEVVGWHHQCNKHEPGQNPGDGKGQEGLAVHWVAKSQTQLGNFTFTFWCWERSRAEEEGVRGWDGWVASPMQRTWTWANSGRWWGAGRPSSPWVCKESDTTGQLNNKHIKPPLMSRNRALAFLAALYVLYWWQYFPFLQW